MLLYPAFFKAIKVLLALAPLKQYTVIGVSLEVIPTDFNYSSTTEGSLIKTRPS